MMTLKNAMNAGTSLLNQGIDERLELVAQWTIPYQQFDGILRYLDKDDQEIEVVHSTGFYDTFTTVSTFAREHGFSDTWQVQTISSSTTVPTHSEVENT
jgi:hypothetical protein